MLHDTLTTKWYNIDRCEPTCMDQNSFSNKEVFGTQYYNEVSPVLTSSHVVTSQYSMCERYGTVCIAVCNYYVTCP